MSIGIPDGSQKKYGRWVPASDCIGSIAQGYIGFDGRHEQYDCRPGDVLSPELDKVKEKSAAYAKTEEEQIMCALFPTTGKEFCEKRHGGE